MPPNKLNWRAFLRDHLIRTVAQSSLRDEVIEAIEADIESAHFEGYQEGLTFDDDAYDKGYEEGKTEGYYIGFAEGYEQQLTDHT